MSFENPKERFAVDVKKTNMRLVTTGNQQVAVTTETATVRCVLEPCELLDWLIGVGGKYLHLHEK